MYGFVILLVVFIILLIDVACIIVSSDADKRMKNIDIKKRSDE